MKKPVANLPVLFTTQAGYIISPAMLTDQEVAKKPAGTGPFVFEEHVPGKVWSFTKNKNYRQKDLPHLDAIDFVPVVDAVERNNQLRKGDLDVIQTNVGPQILDLRSSDYKQVENPRGDKSFLMVNTTKPRS
jgi:ABC-type transport system substrate-binding protein